MARNRYRRTVILSLLLFPLLALAVLWMVGWMLARPAMRTIGPPPPDLPAQAVAIRDEAMKPVYGWFVAGENNGGAVLLLHGVRANRLSMVERARFLHAAGYSVLMIDFQASGESPGKAVTFGYREAADVKAALHYLHRRLPGERVGIIGTSMGGAATLLAEPQVHVDAVVLEQVYPTIRQALDDRLRIYLGSAGPWLAPFMLATLHAQLGIYPAQLSPIEHIGHWSVPKLLIVGDRDQHTTIAESYAMFQAAATPKELWVVHGAEHVDLCHYAGAAYKAKVLAFLNAHLRDDGQPSRHAAIGGL